MRILLPLGEPGIQWAMNPDIYPFTELKRRFQDFCRLRRVVLISQALAPERELDPSKGKRILNLNLYLFKVVLFSYMGDLVLLPFTGSLMHQWSQLFLPFF